MTYRRSHSLSLSVKRLDHSMSSPMIPMAWRVSCSIGRGIVKWSPMNYLDWNDKKVCAMRVKSRSWRSQRIFYPLLSLAVTMNKIWKIFVWPTLKLCAHWASVDSVVSNWYRTNWSDLLSSISLSLSGPRCAQFEKVRTETDEKTTHRRYETTRTCHEWT